MTIKIEVATKYIRNKCYIFITRNEYIVMK